MTTIYTPILKEYFWEWATVPVIHTLDYQNIQSFDPCSVFVEFGDQIERRYFSKQSEIVPNRIIEHLQAHSGSILVFDICTEVWWTPQQGNFWNQVYTDIIACGIEENRIHFIHNNCVQQNKFSTYFPHSKHSNINWWEIFTHYHKPDCELPSAKYEYSFFNRSLKAGRTNFSYQLLTDPKFTSRSLYSLQGRDCRTWEDQAASTALQHNIIQSFPTVGDVFTPSQQQIQAWFDSNPWQSLPADLDSLRDVYDYSSYFYDELYYATALGKIAVVAETWTSEPEDMFFVTEKLFRPITVGRSFVVLSTCRYLKYLHSLGYQSFSTLWNEGYDEIEDIHERSYHLKVLINNLHNSHYDTQEIIAHNLATIIERTEYSRIIKGFDPGLAVLFKSTVDLSTFFKR